MKNILLPLLLTIVFACGCKKKIDAPGCIRHTINEQKNSNPYLDKVDEYLFQDKKVYVFETSGIADGTTPVYDDKCNVLCQLGGLLGTMNCQGQDFYPNAVYLRTVWKR